MLAVCQHFEPRVNLCIPNYQRGTTGYEADILVIRPTLWAEEIEIKVSFADFKRDFTSKPGKHVILQQGKPRHITISHPEYQEIRELFNAGVPDIERVNPRYYRDRRVMEPHFCKKFWYAVPLDLYPKVKDLVPSYAGLLVIGLHNNRPKATVVIKAPTLKYATKMEQEDLIHALQSTYHRFWNLEYLRHEHAALKKMMSLLK